MKSWLKLSVLCLALFILGSPAAHVCRIAVADLPFDIMTTASAAGKALSLS